MKPIIAIIAACLILGATTFVAYARWANVRSYDELDKTSDIIVVAKPVATTHTAEKTNLPNFNPDVHVVGLSSEFQIIAGLKGADSLKKLIVHHYRLANAKDELMINGPTLASFDPNKPTRYLLFLQREPDGRYAPFDQVDPVETSILQLSGTDWDRMTPERFKAWLDARRRLGERPSLDSEGRLHETAMNDKLEKATKVDGIKP